MDYTGPERRNNQNCENQHCDDHSGMLAWLKGIAALLAIASGLIGYSVLGQAPSLQLQIARAIAELQMADQNIRNDIHIMRGDIGILKDKMSKLEQ